MIRFIALLRAVNVGGTGKLPMSQLKELCAEVGFGRDGGGAQQPKLVELASRK